jgi:uncharacterized protein
MAQWRHEIKKCLHSTMAASSPQTQLLVDGYNVIGAWSELSVLRDRDGLEAARSRLIEELANYSAFEGYQTRLVFDAHYRDTPGCVEIVTNTLELYYTDYGETADTHIEIFCAQSRTAVIRPKRLIVATNDRAQQLTVCGYGAEWRSAQQLICDIEIIALKIQRKQKFQKRAGTRLLAHSLNPEAKRKLEQWRYGKN